MPDHEPTQCNANLQDLEGGGIGDRPGDWVDVFHTIFGVAGKSSLSLFSCFSSTTYSNFHPPFKSHRIVPDSDTQDYLLLDIPVYKILILFIVCPLLLLRIRDLRSLLRHYLD
jgi:hypothetical protein